ncbi:MAG: hypothetical protein SGCHY_004017 [Lobulomycetales sp.]
MSGQGYALCTLFNQAIHDRKYRDLWEHYFGDADAVIFVLDSSDRLRACVARDELELMLASPVLAEKRVPILFFANKSDLPDTMTPAELSQIMGLESIKNHHWHIQGTNGISGEGISSGMSWLIQTASKLMK